MSVRKYFQIIAIIAILLFHQISCFAVENVAALKRGYQNYEKGNYAQAAVEINDYLEENPEDYNSICLLGMVLIEKGDIKEAVQIFNIAVEVNPDKWEAYGFLAEIHDTLKDYDNAIDYYGKTLAVKDIDRGSRNYYSDLRKKAKVKLAKQKKEETVAKAE